MDKTNIFKGDSPPTVELRRSLIVSPEMWIIGGILADKTKLKETEHICEFVVEVPLGFSKVIISRDQVALYESFEHCA